MPDRFDKFSERARRVLELAQQEALRYRHKAMDTEHLLLGILDEGEGVAAKVLGTLAGDLAAVRAAVEARMAPGDEAAQQEVGLTPASKRAIEFAVFEARNLNHGYIGTEHLLLGLLREEKGTAAAVLNEQGFTVERVRAEVTRILQQSQPQQAGPSFNSTIRSEGPDPIVMPHLSPQLRPLYTLVLRLRDAKDAALFAGKSDILAAVRSQEAAMQQLLEERVAARSAEGPAAASGNDQLREAERGLEHLREELERARASGQGEYAAELENRMDRLTQRIQQLRGRGDPSPHLGEPS